MELRPFQRRFLKGALATGIDIAALSIPRGNGKSWLAAYVLQRCLTPGDALNVPGAEYILCAASLEQARIVFRFLRGELEISGVPNKEQPYRWLDSTTKVQITHKLSNTRLRIMASNGKTAMGITGCPLLVADEPGAWEATGGQLMSDAIETALGKPGSEMKVIYIGTLAPAKDGWWHARIEGGSTGSTYVQVLKGKHEKWDQWTEIKRVNPLTVIAPAFRKRLLEERNAARADSRLKARFLSYRLNVPTADENTLLVSAEDWRACEVDELPEASGPMVLGVDLSSGYAMSAAAAYWPATGRLQGLCAFPSEPGLKERGERDSVADLYQRMADRQELIVTEGRTVNVGQLLHEALSEFGRPTAVVCDRWRLNELKDGLEVTGIPPGIVITRGMGWQDGSEDVRGFQRGVKEGRIRTPVSLAARSAFNGAVTVSDPAGNLKLAKKSEGHRRQGHKDDLAAAIVLAVGTGLRHWKPGQEAAADDDVVFIAR